MTNILFVFDNTPVSNIINKTQNDSRLKEFQFNVRYAIMRQFQPL